MRRHRLPIAAAIALGLCLAGAGVQKETTMTKTARGSFDVDLQPLAEESFPGDNVLGRLDLEKTYRGDLEATATGEMLTARTAVKGSAGYVAVEHVDGTLGDRRGTFLLHHLGTMGHGEESLTITVVPDSGTGELEGLEGRLTIEIEDGDHFYGLEYTLPDEG